MGVGARPVDGMSLRLRCQKPDVICTGYCAAEWVSYFVSGPFHIGRGVRLTTQPNLSTERILSDFARVVA